MNMILTSQDFDHAARTNMPAGLAKMINKADRFTSDDQLAAFLSRELEASQIKVLMVPQTQLPLVGGAVIPINSSIPEGADSFTYVVEDGSGIAKWHDDYASGDMPMVSVSAEEFQQPIREFALGWQISVKDMRNSAFAGRGDLNTKLGNRALRGMNEFHEYVGMYGDPTRGLKGFANHPNVPVLLPTYDPVALTTDWKTKSGDLIQADIVNMKQHVHDVTNGMRSLERLAIPSATWISLGRPYQVQGATNVAINSKNIQQFLVEENPEIQFAPLLRLQSDKSQAPPLTPQDHTIKQLANDRVVGYVNNSEVVEYVQPISPRFMAPQWYEMRMKTPGYSTTGGTVFYEPFACVYMDVG